jgi:protein-disulfide isomerase
MMSIRRTIVVLAGALVLIGAYVIVAQVSSEQRGPDVVATVGNRSITLDELDNAWGERDPASRGQIRQQLYDSRRQVLDRIIGEQLLELEAKARGMTTPQLLEAEMPKRLQPVTDEEVGRFYRELGSEANGATLQELGPSIRKYLEQQRPVLARQSLIDELRTRSTALRVLLEPPRFTVTTADTDPGAGPVNAPVQIVEFSDFQCPFCQRAVLTVKKLQGAYGDRIHLVYKDFPLPNHPQAFPAAVAANCAREQGKFWEYHDRLFANQQALGSEDLKRHAAELGLDAAKFASCVDDGRMQRLVQADMDESQRYGVSSTPTFFINGRLVSGAQPYEVFDRIIQEELARGPVRK